MNQGPALEGRGGDPGADRGPGQVGHATPWGSTWAPARSWRRGARARSSSRGPAQRFHPVPYSPFTERTIQQQNNIHYYREGDDLVIYGSATERFANIFNAESRRPMADGILNPRGEAGVAGAGGDPREPRAQGPGGRGDARLLHARRPSRTRGRSSPTTRPRCGSTCRASATRRSPSTRGWPSSSRSSRTRTSPASASPAGAGCATAPSPSCPSPPRCSAIAKGGDYIDRSVGQVVNEHARRG